MQFSATDEKQIDDCTHVVRQSFRSFITSVFMVQFIVLFTLLLIIFALGFIGPNTLVVISKPTLITILVILLIFADISITISLFLTWKYTYYIIRPNEIIIRAGIVNIKEKSYQMNQVESVSVIQGLLGRILDYGSMRIFSPMLEDKLTIFQIPSPHKYRDMVIKFSQVQQQHEAAKKTQLIPDVG